MTPQPEKVRKIIRYVARAIVTLHYGGELPALPEGIDYRDVYKMAKWHSLGGALWPIHEAVVTATGDTELISRWSREYELDVAKNLVQTAEFKAVTALLAENEIPFLPMKGFIFKALWRRPEYRTMSDMDIYVRAEDVKKVGSILTERGYAFSHGGSVHDSYEKPPYVNIEIHHMRGYCLTDFDDWTPKADNPYWYTMTDEDCLLFVLAHTHKHYLAGGCGLRAVFDIRLYLEANGDTLDMEYVNSRLRELGLYDFYELVMRFDRLWYGDGEVEQTEEVLRDEYFLVTGGTYGTVENRVEQRLKKKSRLGYILSRLFPPYRSMKYLYTWLQPMPFLLPFAWIIRLVVAMFDGRMRREIRATRRHDKRKSDLERMEKE